MPFSIKILDHNYCQLIDYPESVKKLLSYTEQNYNSRKRSYSFTHHSLINFETNTTYTGLVGHIADLYSTVQIEDFRVFPDYELNEPQLTKEFRPYQIDYLIAALREKRYIVHALTALGKTLMIAAILDTLNLRTLIIAPNKTILGQLHTELRAYLPHREFSIVGDGQKDISKNQVIGLTKSLITIPIKDLTKFQVVLIDEAHTAAAQQTHDLILSINAPFRFGFTGTPTGRSDNRDLVNVGLIGKIGDKLIDRVEAVEKGYLASTTVQVHRGWFLGNFVNIEDLLIVNNPYRNKLILQIVKENKRQSILILVRRLEHGKILQEMIGDESFFITGNSDIEEREDVRQDIKNGKYRVLIATKVFGAGLDIPCLELGINAQGGKGEIVTGQGAGRIVRPWNEVAKVWIDIYDEWNSTLEDHSKNRIKIYKEQGIPVNFIGFPPGKEAQLKELE